MLSISKKTMFAIEAVLDTAYNAGERPVQSSDISERQGIPRRYLEPVMQQLVHAGVLDGVRGPRGGYRLGRERERISLAQIADVVASTSTSAASEMPPSSRLGQEIVQPICSDLEARWMKQLAEITIEDLVKQARKNGVPPIFPQPAEKDSGKA